MKVGIGIDTGGTYTDVITCDYETGETLSKAKTLTTKDDLTICISNAVKSIPNDLLKQAEVLCLSTTLATNACVEGKGIHAKLVIVGVPQEVLLRVDAKNKYGLDPNDVLCVDANGAFDGSRIDEPDWQALYEQNIEWFTQAQALCISEVNALRNAAVVEKRGCDFFSRKLNVPVSAATDLATQLNALERGATALLNSRLVPVISEFIDAVTATISKMNLDIPVMIVRSDGSLMNTNFTMGNPVQTILSGPASSVIGGKALTELDNCIIVDIGGTTTDISIIERGTPAISDTTCIGGWSTQVRGVFIDTYGLGGDSVIRCDGPRLTLGTRRVIPLCVAASDNPQILDDLQDLVQQQKRSTQPEHEFLYIAKYPASLEDYTDKEKRLLDLLEKGPVMLGAGVLPIYGLKSERLENEGTLMRFGMTPTDFMHLKGDFNRFDSQASLLAAMHIAYNVFELSATQDPKEYIDRLCDDAYRIFKKRLFECLSTAMLRYRYPYATENEESLKVFKRIINERWQEFMASSEKPLISEVLDIRGPVVGIGAPTHVFLPTVAEALGIDCVIPENFEVANAIGCALSDIMARIELEVVPNGTAAVEGIYRVDTPEGAYGFEDIDEAEAFALKCAISLAQEEACKRGAIGEFEITTDIKRNEIEGNLGITMNLGTEVTAICSGKML